MIFSSFLDYKNSLSNRSILSYLYDKRICELFDKISYMTQPIDGYQIGFGSETCSRHFRQEDDSENRDDDKKEEIYAVHTRYSNKSTIGQFNTYAIGFIQLVLAFLVGSLLFYITYGALIYLYIILTFFNIDSIFFMSNSLFFGCAMVAYWFIRLVYLTLFPMVLAYKHMKRIKRRNQRKIGKCVIYFLLSYILASSIEDSLFTRIDSAIMYLLNQEEYFLGAQTFLMLHLLYGGFLVVEILNCMKGQKYAHNFKKKGFAENLYSLLVIWWSFVLFINICGSALVFIWKPFRETLLFILEAMIASLDYKKSK